VSERADVLSRSWSTRAGTAPVLTRLWHAWRDAWRQRGARRRAELEMRALADMNALLLRDLGLRDTMPVTRGDRRSVHDGTAWMRGLM
jgi:hypothetical protein